MRKGQEVMATPGQEARGRRDKGQIEAIVFSVIFLVVAVVLMIGTIIALLAAHGKQFSLRTDILAGTNNPIAFTSGAILHRDSLGRTMVEQGIHALYTGQGELAAQAGGIVGGLLRPYGVESFALSIKDRNEEIGRAGNIVKFCGKPAQKTYAYCFPKRTADGMDVSCPVGSSPFRDGQGACGQDETCCAENYVTDATLERPGDRSKYSGVGLFQACHTYYAVSGAAYFVGGVCERTCSAGRIPTDPLPNQVTVGDLKGALPDAMRAISPNEEFSIAHERGGCSSPEICCKPSLSTEPVVMVADTASVPLVYRRSPARPEGSWGSLEISISEPKFEAG